MCSRGFSRYSSERGSRSWSCWRARATNCLRKTSSTMSPAERHAYDEHLSAIMIQNDVLDSAKLEGKIEGREEGLAEGLERTAQRMKALGIDSEMIRQVTGLGPGEYD